MPTNSEQAWTVERVEELLAKVKPWPWSADEMTPLHDGLYEWFEVNDSSDQTIAEVTCDYRSTFRIDAEFIAAAPEIIRFLLDSLTRARQEARDQALRDAADIIHGALVPYTGGIKTMDMTQCSRYLVGALEAARDKEKG